ncbi:hypothetical protein [Solirubrobacter soli]|uniref:hypothetical protein n=1 Tax=Solirubrobacter soli TaxID=363832 RepID=UPI0012F74A7D|nr:hypothetical protein [Solirubrobacter soli]
MAAAPMYDDDDEVIFQVISAERELEGEPVAEQDACLPAPDGVEAAPTAAVEAAPAMITVNQLDGVPLFYARGPGAPAQHSFAFDPTFHDECVAIIRSVRFRVPDSYGKLKRITTAGTFVAKDLMHGKARAMDHDRWQFENIDIHPFKGDHASSDIKRRRRYWALAAIMRSHSAYLLHGEYNAPHRDHLHSDNGGSFPFDTGSEATVKLVQAICKHIFGNTALAIDGDYGPKSKAAVAAAMAKLELTGDITNPSQFKRFLMRSGRLGFVLGA